LLDESGMAAYIRQLEDYRYWLSTVADTRVPFSGKIEAVYPSLLKIVDYQKSEMRLDGFLLRFDQAHIGYDLFDDRIYMHIGQAFLKKWKPAAGDEIDCRAILKTDRGRIVLINPTQVEFAFGDDSPIIDHSRALVGKSTGAIVEDDNAECRGCPYGALLDVVVIRPQPNQYRRFFCLRGVAQSRDCPVRLEQKMQEYKEQPAES
jgi:hypothetical protein